MGEMAVPGTSRHSSIDQYPPLCPIRRSHFFNDFDPTEGHSTVHVRAGDQLDVLEIRRGNVLSYLGPGDYTGRGEDCTRTPLTRRR